MGALLLVGRIDTLKFNVVPGVRVAALNTTCLLSVVPLVVKISSVVLLGIVTPPLFFMSIVRQADAFDAFL